MAAGGTKLPRINPWARTSAIHIASFTSGLRPVATVWGARGAPGPTTLRRPRFMRSGSAHGWAADMKAELDATLAASDGRRERFLVDLARHRRENDAAFPSDRTLAERVQD